MRPEPFQPRNPVMTRFFHIAAALGAMSTLVACSGGADPGTSGGTAGSASTDDSTSDGFIFKGPMGTEGSITITALGPDLHPVLDDDGNELSVTENVLSDDGAYEVNLPGHQGLVRIEATGPVFNEAVGAKHTDESVTLLAYGEVGERTSVHVNLLTDLIHERLKERLLEGVPFTEAQQQVMEEFFEALPYTDREPPQVHGHELNPHESGYEAAWLLGFSSIVAEAARATPPDDSDHDDHFETGGAMDNIRNDFAGDGTLSTQTTDMLWTAEELLNPDLVTLGLKKHHADGAFVHVVPDLHKFLDTDHDGILNDEDNCRYHPNPDQTPVDGETFGIQCDTRLVALSADENWGCGVTSNDSYLGPAGSVACWEVEGAKTGGAPPHPDQYQGAPHAPWGEMSPFAGMGGDSPTFTEVVVAGSTPSDPWICAVVDGGAMPDVTICWDSLVPEAPTPLAVAIEGLTISEELVCGTDPTTLGTACFTRSGAASVTLLDTLSDVTLFGAATVCGIEDSGDGTGPMSCVDGTGATIPLPPEVDGEDVLAIDGNTAQNDALGCAILLDGSAVCFDLNPGDGGLIPPPTPEGTGFVDIAVGLGTACATDAAGAVTCTQRDHDDPAVMEGDAFACPPHGDPPAFATNIQIDTCHACGIDDQGFGTCWPTNWERLVGEGEPVYGGGGSPPGP